MARVTRYVYDFDEPAEGGRDLLGGKGVGLAEMTQLGVPVPRGFTITTDACRAFMREGGSPAGLEEQVGEHIGAARGEDRKALRRHRGPAARVGAIGSRRIDARDDGHDPQPRAERRRSRRPRAEHGQPALRPRLVPAPDPDVRRGRRQHRRAPLRAGARRSQARARREAGRRSLAGRSRRARRDVQGHLWPGDRRWVSPGRARAAPPLRAGRVRVLGEPACPGVPAHIRHPGRHRDGGERRPDGVRQQGRSLRHGGVLHARSVDRGSRPLRRVSS